MAQTPLAAQVSVFRGSTNTTPVETLPLANVLQRIRDGTYRVYVDYLRHILASGDSERYRVEKEKSIAFTPCCALHTRAKDVPWSQKLISTTGLVYFDLDHVDDPDTLKHQVTQDSHVAFAFVSPSAQGLKIGIAASGITGPEDYKHIWAVVLDALKRTYPDVHFNEDTHVRFLNALCYVSYDPRIYVHSDAVPFVVPPPTPKSAPTPRRTDATPDYPRVASALACIPNNEADYDTWLLLGMALHSTGEFWARDLWDGWSRQSGKFDARKQEKSWGSFTSDGSVTIASLFHLAKQYGYVPQKPSTLHGGARNGQGMPASGAAQQNAHAGHGQAAPHQAVLQALDAGEAVGAHAQDKLSAGAVWRQAVTAQDFLQHEEVEVLAYVNDMVVPGCITNVSAPRASGKSLVALYLGVALARGGVFRHEHLTQRRVLLVDRDNPRSLIRKRLGWLGAHQVTSLKVLTRETAPPLTYKAAWDQFPVEDYDVVMVDSLGSSTEGVSEKEGRQTQEFLATLKDLARRGPAILCLDNTNKAGTNYRGRGEKADAVDILYECRNITGWTPPQGGEWWEHLPDFGEHTWQERATRRTGQAVLRVAFVPTKFRLGIEPEPFVLEIDTRQTPWTLRDVTEDIATAGEQAAQEASRHERAKITRAQEALVRAIRECAADAPLLKSEAEALIREYGLQQKAARTLLESGGNHDIYPSGQWIIRQIPRHPTGKALGVYLVREEEDDQRSNGIIFPSTYASNSAGPFVDGSTLDDERSASMRGAFSLEKNSTALSSPPGDSMTKGETPHEQQRPGVVEGGRPFVTFTDSSAPCGERSVAPPAPGVPPCARCAGLERWNDHGIWRCVACWPAQEERTKHDKERELCP